MLIYDSRKKYVDKLKALLGNGALLGGIISVLFVLAHFVLPLEPLKAASDNFNKIAIGIAAIITGYFGSSYFREELSRKRSIEFYRKKYPPENYKITYRIIESERNPGAIYLHDLESTFRHHIWNMKTVFDLGWQTYDRERLTHEEFMSYIDGPPIRTRGDLGE